MERETDVSEAQDSRPPGPQSEFERAGTEEQLSLVQEFLLFIVQNKKWWLTPILLALALVGLLVVLGSTGAAPFIYTLF
jgi:hypothetical protein